MRFFYVKSIKKYIAIPGFILFLVSFSLHFFPIFFSHELLLLNAIKETLGFEKNTFPINSLFALKILFSLFYAFFGSILGIWYYRFKNRNSGHTLVLSDSFHAAFGICYLFLIYALLHSEAFAINSTVFSQLKLPLNLSRFYSLNIQSLFTPKIIINPVNMKSNPNLQKTTNPPSRNTSQSQTFNNPPPSIPIVTAKQATAQELFKELNAHRQINGRAMLKWDTQLSTYSQSRAITYENAGTTDNHTGFTKDTEGGLNFTLGFYGLTENSSYGTIGNAKYIIEERYGKSTVLNNNQLDNKWTHVGIGVTGKAINFIFGSGKTDTFHIE